MAEYRPKTNKNSLRDQFLIAMPMLEDSLFSHSVTYICDHNEHGAMGVIINHPMDLTLGEVFDQLQLTTLASVRPTPVLAGGPVNAEQGLVLHRDEGKWESTMHVTPEICLTASRDIVEAMATGKGPKNAQLALGYAGWGAGQLEEEITNNCWLTLPASSSIIFDTPLEQRWTAAAQQLGVDINLVSAMAGHA